MSKNTSKLTAENVKAFTDGLRAGDTASDISKRVGITEKTLSNWKQRAESDNPLLGDWELLKPLRSYLQGESAAEERKKVRAALVDSLSEIEIEETTNIKEIVKVLPKERKALGDDLAAAFDAGDIVLVEKTVSTRRVHPKTSDIVKAYGVLFPKGGGGDAVDAVGDGEPIPIIIKRSSSPSV